MNVDRATSFLATHARVLDRRRAQLLVTGVGADAVVAALDGYRNDDGGYGCGLEPDLRSPESQPAAAMVAFEVLGELAPLTTSRGVELCDWLAARSLPDGGLPLVVPIGDPAACASFWATGDPTAPSLQMTAQVAAGALRVAEHDAGVRDHSWLADAVRWCLDAVDRIDRTPVAHELLFAVRFLDALAPSDPRAVTRLERLGRFIPPEGVVRVEGGAEGESLRPLDFSPRPDGAARVLFRDEVVAADIDRLDRGQQPDGGWRVDFDSASPAATLEWRGVATVAALAVLRGASGPFDRGNP